MLRGTVDGAAGSRDAGSYFFGIPGECVFDAAGDFVRTRHSRVVAAGIFDVVRLRETLHTPPRTHRHAVRNQPSNIPEITPRAPPSRS